MHPLLFAYRLEREARLCGFGFESDPVLDQTIDDPNANNPEQKEKAEAEKKAKESADSGKKIEGAADQNELDALIMGRQQEKIKQASSDVKPVQDKLRRSIADVEKVTREVDIQNARNRDKATDRNNMHTLATLGFDEGKEKPTQINTSDVVATQNASRVDTTDVAQQEAKQKQEQQVTKTEVAATEGAGRTEGQAKA